ncbi:MAG: hypothetical protein AAF512_01550 [Pseudomonadota bacterium]
MKKIIIATSKAWSPISTSDKLYAEALRQYGITVEGIPWNDAPLSAFTEADAVILRSNWDYHQDLPAFQHWLSALESSTAQVFNPIELVRWNLDKRYLLELSEHGLPVPETRMIESVDKTLASFDELNCSRAVIKPAWGASGFGVELVDAANCQAVVEHIQQQIPDRPLLMQAFVPEIADGEHSLVFFDAQFSHAFIKRPAEGEYRINSQYGGKNSANMDINAALLALADSILDILPCTPLYARIDLVLRQNGEAVLMEVEVNEPALGLTFSADAPAHFARATLQRLGLA